MRELGRVQGWGILVSFEALPVIVAYEDRTSAIPGVELLARSLLRHSPGLRLEVHSPLEEVRDRLADLPNAAWIPAGDLAGRGWNAKPIILSRGLDAHERVLWLDTDIVLRADLVPRLREFTRGTFVVGQEYRAIAPLASELRAEGFGLKVVRKVPHGINSGSVLADRSHRPLLDRWLALLGHDAYRAAQKRPVLERPVAYVGDQDVLWALLVSDEYADVPLDYFRLGQDMILHCGANGYHVLDRLGHLARNEAAFVHMLGHYKPWSFERPAHWRHARRDYVNQLCFELSPFFSAAKPIAPQIGNPAWLRRRTLPGRLFSAAAFGSPALAGMPLALVAWVTELAFNRRPR